MLQNTEYRLTTMERDNMVLLAKMSHLYRNLSIIKTDQNVERLEIIKKLVTLTATYLEIINQIKM